jgi:hypothetical protein
MTDSFVATALYTIIRDLTLDNLTIGSGAVSYQAINSITANNVTVNGDAAVVFTTGNFD